MDFVLVTLNVNDDDDDDDDDDLQVSSSLIPIYVCGLIRAVSGYNSKL